MRAASAGLGLHKHQAQNAENNVHSGPHDQTFLFGDLNVRRTLRTGETTHFNSHTSFFKRCLKRCYASITCFFNRLHKDSEFFAVAPSFFLTQCIKSRFNLTARGRNI